MPLFNHDIHVFRGEAKAFKQPSDAIKAKVISGEYRTLVDFQDLQVDLSKLCFPLTDAERIPFLYVPGDTPCGLGISNR